MSAIDLAAFERFAAGVGLPVAAVQDAVRDTVRRFRQVWNEHPAVGRLPTSQRKALEAHTPKAFPSPERPEASLQPPKSPPADDNSPVSGA